MGLSQSNESKARRADKKHLRHVQRMERKAREQADEALRKQFRREQKMDADDVLDANLDKNIPPDEILKPLAEQLRNTRERSRK
jgi:hypothetical protein